MAERADGVRKAYDAGASTEGAMAVATHTQAQTSMRYNRGWIAKSVRVAQLRLADRGEK
jgi:hypothetical protein